MPSDQFHRVEKLTGDCEQWIAPTLINSWVDYGGTYDTAGYFKDKFNVVHLKGAIKTGTSGTTAFTLPEGYRPSAGKAIATVAAGGTFGFIDIDSAGNVVVTGTNTFVSLEGVSWRV